MKIINTENNQKEVKKPSHVIKSTFSEVPVFKSIQKELKQVTFVAMQEGVDLHGDFTSLDEVRKAHESFSKSPMRANLFHMTMTDSFSVLESYLSPVDMVLNDHPIQKGTWLMTIQVHDDDLWEMVKSGEATGLSIGAIGAVEIIEEELNE